MNLVTEVNIGVILIAFGIIVANYNDAIAGALLGSGLTLNILKLIELNKKKKK